MFIQEFHTAFMSKRENSRLFDTLRRVSRLETKALQSDEDPVVPGWPEWPPMVPEGPGLERT
jgi:hypothetical protein